MMMQGVDCEGRVVVCGIRINFFVPMLHTSVLKKALICVFGNLALC